MCLRMVLELFHGPSIESAPNLTAPRRARIPAPLSLPAFRALGTLEDARSWQLESPESMCCGLPLLLFFFIYFQPDNQTVHVQVPARMRTGLSNLDSRHGITRPSCGSGAVGACIAWVEILRADIRPARRFPAHVEENKKTD